MNQLEKQQERAARAKTIFSEVRSKVLKNQSRLVKRNAKRSPADLEHLRAMGAVKSPAKARACRANLQRAREALQFTGRPKTYRNSAERQRAYRERCAAKKIGSPEHKEKI
jgi:hypothetical protein